MPRIDIVPDQLRRLLVDEGRSFADVAQRFGVSWKTVSRRSFPHWRLGPHQRGGSSRGSASRFQLEGR